MTITSRSVPATRSSTHLFQDHGVRGVAGLTFCSVGIGLFLVSMIAGLLGFHATSHIFALGGGGLIIVSMIVGLFRGDSRHDATRARNNEDWFDDEEHAA